MPEEMTLKEAVEIVKNFRAAFPAECDELWSKSGDLFDSVLMGEPEAGVSRFQLWAELAWAGDVFDARTDYVVARAKFLKAVWTIVIRVVESAADAAIKGGK